MQQVCLITAVKSEENEMAIDSYSNNNILHLQQQHTSIPSSRSSPSEGSPLVPSNAMNSKQTGNVSSGSTGIEYMQTQNHIFVFSTSLANKSAEAVMNRQFPSIIAYHCAQSESKNFLKVVCCFFYCDSNEIVFLKTF